MRRAIIYDLENTTVQILEQISQLLILNVLWQHTYSCLRERIKTRIYVLITCKFLFYSDDKFWLTFQLYNVGIF